MFIVVIDLSFIVMQLLLWKSRSCEHLAVCEKSIESFY